VPQTPRVSRVFAVVTLLALAALVAAQPAFADTATFNEPVSPSAERMDEVYRAILGVTVTIFVLVGGWLVYSAIRFRERPGQADLPEPPQLHGSTRLEIGWTVVPVLILVGLSAFTFVKLPDVYEQPKGGLEIKVLAQQYGWTYTYPDGKHPAQGDSNTLVVPEDTNVKLTLTSKDVIHDWWVPELAPKVDVIPGQDTQTWFNANRTGTFKGQCAEFCGPGHATMIILVKVLPKQEFETYMNEKATS
jgi:cytochrome c oxidase subunit II